MNLKVELKSKKKEFINKYKKNNRASNQIYYQTTNEARQVKQSLEVSDQHKGSWTEHQQSETIIIAFIIGPIINIYNHSYFP